MEREANPEIEQAIQEELDQTWTDVDSDADQPLKPEEFEAGEDAALEQATEEAFDNIIEDDKAA